MSTTEVLHRLINWQRFYGKGALLHNVYVNGGPWESDLVKVLKSHMYVEFEVKVSTADFHADFEKSHHKFVTDPNGSRRKVFVGKHAYYASTDQSIGSKTVPRPKQFYFVCPRGLLVEELIPEHAGLIYVDITDDRSWGAKVIKRAPTLKHATRLTDKNLYSLLFKASLRLPIGRMFNENSGGERHTDSGKCREG